MPDPAFERAAARADLCRLLAACYYQPGPEFTEEGVFQLMRAAAESVDADLAGRVGRLAEAFVAQPSEPLQVDYTRLFLSPNGAPAAPYESVWIGGKDPVLVREATQRVVDFYAEAGFEIDEQFRDLPDHMAAELECLYALIFREARARSSGDVTEELAATGLRLRFVRLHLGRWTVPFTGAIRAAAETDFYRILAEVTERFVASEGA